MDSAATTHRVTGRRPARRRLAATALVALALAGCTPTSSRSSSSSSSQTVVTSGDAVVVVSAGDGTCWRATVDGHRHSGCGDATFGSAQGRATVVKTRGPGRVGVRLVVGDRTVDRGGVWRSSRSATVDG